MLWTMKVTPNYDDGQANPKCPPCFTGNTIKLDPLTPNTLFKQNVFEPVVHEKVIFKILSKFHLFCPLDLNKPESTFSKDMSYQLWLKSSQWFWRSCLKEIFDRQCMP